MRFTNIVSDISAWIEANKYHNLKIEEIVERSGFSRRHLQRFFKEKTLMSIGTYSRLRRLSAAAISLRITNNSINDISRAYGFDSPATFISAFRHLFGTTPGHFREQDDWSFENMVPRYDFISRANELDCRLIKSEIYAPFMKSTNLQEITSSLTKGASGTILISNAKMREEFKENTEVSLAYALCGEEKVSAQKKHWIAVKVSEDIDCLPALQNLIYAGLLPSLGITRPRAPDMINVNKTDDGKVFISEYLIPCIIRNN